MDNQMDTNCMMADQYRKMGKGRPDKCYSIATLKDRVFKDFLGGKIGLIGRDTINKFLETIQNEEVALPRNEDGKYPIITKLDKP